LNLIQIPVLMHDSPVTLVLSAGVAVAGVFVAWKILRPKSK
jgi:hypothetical protein